MPEREKVMRALEMHSKIWKSTSLSYNCEDVVGIRCPYDGCRPGCTGRLASDALALLKEQEQRKTARGWKVAGTFDDFNQCPQCGNMWPILSTIEWAYCPVCGCSIFSVPEPPKEDADENADL